MQLLIQWNGNGAETHEVATVIRAAGPIPNLPAGLTDHQLLEHAAAEGLIRLLCGVLPNLVADRPNLIEPGSSQTLPTGCKSSG